MLFSLPWAWDSTPSWGTKIPQAARCGKKKEKKWQQSKFGSNSFSTLCFKNAKKINIGVQLICISSIAVLGKISELTPLYFLLHNWRSWHDHNKNQTQRSILIKKESELQLYLYGSLYGIGSHDYGTQEIQNLQCGLAGWCCRRAKVLVPHWRESAGESPLAQKSQSFSFLQANCMRLTHIMESNLLYSVF